MEKQDYKNDAAGPDDDAYAQARRLQLALGLDPAHEPRTGVGTPDAHAVAAGAELGGDTGDVGTPGNDLECTPGGTCGTSSFPETRAGISPEAIRAKQRQRRPA
ncbi:MAG TPA: hypothetical protein VGL77_00715 [Armatimonadota bacterium]|jgi:hypothetical protein